jgi:hydrogenase-4 component B
MPLTAGAFLIGAVAISGLPPLNGFVSEFFIYLGFFRSAEAAVKLAALALLGAPVLAMIGALAVSCFVKVYGAVFLGLPRTDAARNAHESPLSMLVPMGILAFVCLGIGMFPVLVVPFLEKAIAVWQRGPQMVSGAEPAGNLAASGGTLSGLVPFKALGTLMAVTVVALASGFVLFFLYRRAKTARSVTWDCGYARPTARMQYTAGSFARTLTRLFGKILKPREHLPHLSGAFPLPARLESHVDDPVLDGFLLPDFNAVRNGTRWFHRFQQGQTQSYILYLVVALGIIFCTLIPFHQLFVSFFMK